MTVTPTNLPQIDIAIHTENWRAIYSNEDALHSICEKAILASGKTALLSWPQMAELSIVFTDDTEMTGINGEWRNIHKPTYVLSFPGDDIEVGEPAGPMIGDIIFAFETIEREAKEQSKTFENHLTHLLVHGFLHLFGHDHIEDLEAENMESLETKILASLAISDPYD